MLILLLLYSYIFLSTVAVGQLVATLFFKNRNNLSFDLLSLAGFIGLTCILNLIHLFFPLGGIIPHFFIVCLIICYRKSIVQKIKQLTLPKAKPSFYLLILSLFISSLIVAAVSPLIGDSLGYHIQVLGWVEKFAVVPGIADIHTRLGLHSVIFPTMAFFDFSFAYGQPLLGVNSYFNLLMLIRVVYEIYNDSYQKRYDFVFFEGLFIFFNLYFLFCNYITSPSPDYISSIIIFYIFIILKKGKDNINYQVLLILSSLFLPFIKLSQIVFAFLPLFFIRLKRLWVIYFAIAIAFGIPYIAHNYIQTGYFFYPTPYFNFANPDWQLPLRMPQDSESAIVSLTSLQSWIISWARLSDVHFSQVLPMPLSEWFPIWVKNNSYVQNGLLLLVILSVFFTFSQKKQLDKRWFWLNSICWVSIIFWLLTAPSFRFAYGFLWLAALSPLLMINLIKISSVHFSSFLPYIFILLLIFFKMITVNKYELLILLFI